MTIGIIAVDCATQPRKTGLAFAYFENGKARLGQITIGSSASGLVETIAAWRRRCDYALYALDAPLGWPAKLGRALTPHTAGGLIHTEPNELFRRETDRFIKARIGKQPLDVGADRIARSAHAALSLLDTLRGKTGEAIPLAWEPGQCRQSSAIEVYPAATLLAYQIQATGYKHKGNHQARQAIISRLRAYMEISIDSTLAEGNHDALDAVVCALAGLDFLKGEVYRPADLEASRKEGWIWVRKQKSK